MHEEEEDDDDDMIMNGIDKNSQEEDYMEEVVGELFPQIDFKKLQKQSTSISKKSA